VDCSVVGTTLRSYGVEISQQFKSAVRRRGAEDCTKQQQLAPFAFEGVDSIEKKRKSASQTTGGSVERDKQCALLERSVDRTVLQHEEIILTISLLLASSVFEGVDSGVQSKR